MIQEKHWYWERDLESFHNFLKILKIATTPRSKECCNQQLNRIQSKWPAPFTQKIFNDMRKEMS